MPNANLRTNASGFSLLELIIVLAILGVIVTFAVLSLGGTSAVLARQNVAKELKVALERARFDSVKRRPQSCADMSRVEILSATSFRYITDTNQDGTLQPGQETRSVDFGSTNGVRIVGDPAPTFPITIRFDQRGHTTSGACGSETPAVTPTHFCETGCGAISPANTSSVYVSPTGTVALLLGGDDPPTFIDPTVSNVASESGINRFLSVWTGTPPTPTPVGTPGGTPSPSPTGTPTADPTPDPDPSATPTPVPTPTPTPAPLDACRRNDRPGNPPTCDCRPPYFVQGNGQCK